LQREGRKVNAKRIYRLYREEGLQVRTAKRAKGAARVRVPLAGATRRNQRWSMDFVSDRLDVSLVFLTFRRTLSLQNHSLVGDFELHISGVHPR
jgi:transposase InsO family protein